MDAPKRIWGIPHRDDESPHSLGVFWSVQCSEDDDEYILAAEHDRLMAEKDAEIARLQEALKAFTGMEASISSDVSSAHNGRIGAAGWMVEDDRDFRRDLRNAFGAARAALGGDNG